MSFMAESCSTRWIWLTLSAGAVLLAGCAGGQGPGGQSPGQSASRPAAMIDPNVEDTIVGVIAYYNSFNPWIWNDAKTKPIGIDVQALYLAGPKSKGVFGNGVIRPRMYTRTFVNGEEDYKLIKEWSYNTQEAIPWRSNKVTVQGVGYRIPLLWEDVNLAGKEIRMIVAFERTDGKMVLSSKKDFKVPGTVPIQQGKASVQ